MYLPDRDSTLYLALSLALTWFILQLATKPEAEPAVPLFPTTGHNADLPLDVDGDGAVTTNDTALLLDSLQSLESELPLPVSEVCTAHPYLDVDGDGFLSEHDAKLMFRDDNQVPVLAPALGPQPPSNTQATAFLARK